jgi:hypothetical protein
MKKLVHVVAVAVIAVIPLALAGSASAASTCKIGYTGPDSQNNCTIVSKYNCSVVNENTVKINNDNYQFTTSGNAATSGNTTAGSATSGTATNSNGTSFGVTITNGTMASKDWYAAWTKYSAAYRKADSDCTATISCTNSSTEY